VEGRATRFRLVDPGEYIIGLEIAVEPGPGEKLGVRVRYKDGGTPAYATLALVSHPMLVDKEVEVVRRPRTVEALEAELTALRAQYEASGPMSLVFSRQLDRRGVQSTDFQGMVPPDNKSGLTVGLGTGYRATRWALVAVPVTNLPGQKPGSSVRRVGRTADQSPCAWGGHGLKGVRSRAVVRDLGCPREFEA